MSEHKEKVSKMFSEITKKYDFLNHFFSLGIDYWWRHVLVTGFVFSSKKKALDMAAGTLDVTLKTIRTYQDVEVIAGDICLDMLEYGKEKTRGSEIDRICCQEIDAMAIPYEENSFDIVSIAFGIRNVEDRVKALSEMHRVLEVGGQLHILEFAPIQNKYLQKAYYWYLEKAMPKLAEFFGAKSDAYEYLSSSIRNFPKADDFCEEIKQAGFDFVKYKKLTFGIVTIYIAIKSK